MIGFRKDGRETLILVLMMMRSLAADHGLAKLGPIRKGDEATPSGIAGNQCPHRWKQNSDQSIFCAYKPGSKKLDGLLELCLCTHLVYYPEANIHHELSKGKNDADPLLTLNLSKNIDLKTLLFIDLPPPSTDLATKQVAYEVFEKVQRQSFNGIFSTVISDDGHLGNKEWETYSTFFETLRTHYKMANEGKPLVIAIRIEQNPIDASVSFAQAKNGIDYFVVPERLHERSIRSINTMRSDEQDHPIKSYVDQLMDAGIPRRRIIIEASAFGSIHYGNRQGQSRHPIHKSLTYPQVCQLALSSGWQIVNEYGHRKSLVLNRHPSQIVRYNDEESLKQKVQLVRFEHLGGMMLSFLNDDDYLGVCNGGSFPLLKSMNNIFKSPENFSRLNENQLLQQQPSTLVKLYAESDATRQTRSIGVIRNQCKRKGYFRDKKDCSRFYQCARSTPSLHTTAFTIFHYKCPEGKVFDDEHQICTWPSWASPCITDGSIVNNRSRQPKRTEFPRFSCPGPGYHGDPNNCRWFYYCADIDGKGKIKAFEFRCPSEDLGFDQKLLMCNWKHLVPGCKSLGASLMNGTESEDETPTNARRIRNTIRRQKWNQNSVEKSFEYHSDPSKTIPPNNIGINEIPEDAKGGSNRTSELGNLKENKTTKANINRLRNILLVTNNNIQDANLSDCISETSLSIAVPKDQIFHRKYLLKSNKISRKQSLDPKKISDNIQSELGKSAASKSLNDVSNSNATEIVDTQTKFKSPHSKDIGGRRRSLRKRDISTGQVKSENTTNTPEDDEKNLENTPGTNLLRDLTDSWANMEAITASSQTSLNPHTEEAEHNATIPTLLIRGGDNVPKFEFSTTLSVPEHISDSDMTKFSENLGNSSNTTFSVTGMQRMSTNVKNSSNIQVNADETTTISDVSMNVNSTESIFSDEIIGHTANNEDDSVAKFQTLDTEQPNSTSDSDVEMKSNELPDMDINTQETKLKIETTTTNFPFLGNDSSFTETHDLTTSKYYDNTNEHETTTIIYESETKLPANESEKSKDVDGAQIIHNHSNITDKNKQSIIETPNYKPRRRYRGRKKQNLLITSLFNNQNEIGLDTNSTMEQTINNVVRNGIRSSNMPNGKWFVVPRPNSNMRAAKKKNISLTATGAVLQTPLENTANNLLSSNQKKRFRWNVPFLSKKGKKVTNQKIACSAEGLFSHPGDCTKFYECYWDKWAQEFTIHVFSCPTELVFDERVFSCVNPERHEMCANLRK